MGSNEDWVKLGFQMASNSPNHTAQHTCKAELAAWHVVYFVPILVGNGQAHATIQCGHCPPPEAENCNPQNTAEHALGEVMWVILVDDDLSPLLAQNWGKKMCAASSRGPCWSVRKSGWRQSHIIPHLSLAPRKTRYNYIFKARFQHKKHYIKHISEKLSMFNRSELQFKLNGWRIGLSSSSSALHIRALKIWPVVDPSDGCCEATRWMCLA